MDLPDLTHSPILAFFVGFATVFGLAIRFGGAPERYAAIVLLGMPIVQLALYSTVSSDVYQGLDWVSLTVDLFALVAFTIIMLRADRDYWLIAATGFAIVACCSHFARINTDMLGFSYAQFKSFPTGAMIITVLLGTIAHQVRLERDGEDRDWIPLRKYAEFRGLPEKIDRL